ncbi:DNA polymerase III subunit beta [bacterium]|nr:DNA polymerase III subunit beta [bacterium]
MKFSINQSTLLEALQNIGRVVPTRSTTPILENILFDLEDGGLKITGTDLEVSITTRVPVEQVDTPGSIALPARVMTEMIRSLPDISIQFELEENNKLKITTDKGRYHVSGLSKDNYPEQPQFSDAENFTVPNQLIARMLQKTIFAVSSEELRPALMGVFLQIMPDEFRMVATDGHRLSKIVNRGFKAEVSPLKMIIPPKAVQIALKNLEEEGDTELTIDQTGLQFNFGNTTLYTRLVEGEYPDYERVIPRDNDKTLTVDRELLISSVKRVSLFASALTHQIRLELSPNQLLVCSEDLEVGGEGRETLDVEYDGEPMEIGYNANYLLDILRHADTEQVVFKLKSPVRAALITPTAENENESFIMLIMPIKLG